jgi:hypothetical protein
MVVMSWLGGRPAEVRGAYLVLQVTVGPQVG